MLLLRTTFYVWVKMIVLGMTKHFVIDRLFLWMNKMGHSPNLFYQKQPRNWSDWIISVYLRLIVLWNTLCLKLSINETILFLRLVIRWSWKSGFVRFYWSVLIIIYRLVGFMVFNTTFNNISVISWRSVLLVEEIGVLWENRIIYRSGEGSLISIYMDPLELFEKPKNLRIPLFLFIICKGREASLISRDTLGLLHRTKE